MPVLVGAALVVVVPSTVAGLYQLTRSRPQESASPATRPTPLLCEGPVKRVAPHAYPLPREWDGPMEYGDASAYADRMLAAFTDPSTENWSTVARPD